MLKSYIFLVFALSYVRTQTSTVERNARVTDHTRYITNVIQETVNEWERRGFCSLKIDEFTRAINTSMYSWDVVGNVTYTNAFLISIQKLEVNTIGQTIGRRAVDGVQVPFAAVRGTLHLRDSLYGYDVIFDQLDEGVHRYTGTYGYTTTSLVLEVAKNLLTDEITTSASLNNLSGGLARMIYLPANNVTEVLSREFSPVTTWDSVRDWARDTLAPMMLEVATTKIDFPILCYTTNC